MMCDECGIRPANIRLTTIVNGEKKERNLCSECLAHNQKFKTDVSTLAGHLSSLLGALKTGGTEKTEAIPEIECTYCGMTYEKFRKTGMVGCAQCYSDFREPLQALMSRVHGHTQHVGRTPGGEDSRLFVKIKAEKLKQALAKAIGDEEYEAAASLRDQIRALEHRLHEEAQKDE